MTNSRKGEIPHINKNILINIILCVIVSVATAFTTLSLANKVKAPTTEKEIIESMYGYYECVDFQLWTSAAFPGRDFDSNYIGAEVYIDETTFFSSSFYGQRFDKLSDLMKITNRVKQPSYDLVKIEDSFFDERAGRRIPIKKGEAQNAYALFTEEYRGQDEPLTYFLQVEDEYYYVDTQEFSYLKLIKIT